MFPGVSLGALWALSEARWGRGAVATCVGVLRWFLALRCRDVACVGLLPRFPFHAAFWPLAACCSVGCVMSAGLGVGGVAMRPTKVYSAPRLSHLPAGFTLVRLTCGGFLLCLAAGLPGGLAPLPPRFHLAGLQSWAVLVGYL